MLLLAVFEGEGGREGEGEGVCWCALRFRPSSSRRPCRCSRRSEMEEACYCCSTSGHTEQGNAAARKAIHTCMHVARAWLWVAQDVRGSSNSSPCRFTPRQHHHHHPRPSETPPVHAARLRKTNKAATAPAHTRICAVCVCLSLSLSKCQVVRVQLVGPFLRRRRAASRSLSFALH